MAWSGPGSGGLDAPTNLSATGSIDATSVTVSWDSVSHATAYNLYWRSTPGVTPSNRTRIAVTSPHTLDNGRVVYFDTGRSAGSIYYVVTAVGAQGESDPSNETFVTLADGLGVGINQPQGGTLVADSVFFEVYVQSVFEIASVVVAVENRQASLTFSNIMPGGRCLARLPRLLGTFSRQQAGSGHSARHQRQPGQTERRAAVRSYAGHRNSVAAPIHSGALDAARNRDLSGRLAAVPDR